MLIRAISVYIFLLTFTQLVQAQDMNNARLDSLLNAIVPTGQLEGQPGRWQITVDQTIMLVITDEKHDRMRIISPVITVADATPEQILAAMEANFHTALDVKYAIADEAIWVAFIHPLSPLREDQFFDALSQVHSAAVTFGSSYTSTDLVFPKAKADEDNEKQKADKLKQRTKRL